MGGKAKGYVLQVSSLKKKNQRDLITRWEVKFKIQIFYFICGKIRKKCEEKNFADGDKNLRIRNLISKN